MREHEGRVPLCMWFLFADIFCHSVERESWRERHRESFIKWEEGDLERERGERGSLDVREKERESVLVCSDLHSFLLLLFNSEK